MIPVETDAIAEDDVMEVVANPPESPAKPGNSGSNRDALRLARARALDRNTLGGIYDEFQPLIYSYIYRRVGDVESARDLTAEVFRRFLQAIANGNGPSEQLRAWLYRVAHNLIIDHYRRRQNRDGLPLEERIASRDAEPDSTAELHMQCDAVRLALAQLTADQQQIIALKFLEGLSNEEVAGITDKSVGAVKALQHRALAALRRQLIPQAEEDTA